MKIRNIEVEVVLEAIEERPLVVEPRHDITHGVVQSVIPKLEVRCIMEVFMVDDVTEDVIMKNPWTLLMKLDLVEVLLVLLEVEVLVSLLELDGKF